MSGSQLELVECTRQGGGGRTGRCWLDFAVDGEPLAARLAVGDLIGCLGWGAAECEALAIRRLQRKQASPLTDGRLPLYVCPECGDLGCGAVTTRITRDGSVIVWDDFGRQDSDPSATVCREGYSSVGALRFDARTYWQVLEDRLRALERT